MEKQNDERKQSETDATCGSKSAVERRVMADGFSGYYDCEGQIAIHRAKIEQMKADGKMFQNPTQGYWTPKPEAMAEYHLNNGVINLLMTLKMALRP